MKIEVLYLEGCPNHRPTVDLVKKVSTDLGIPDDPTEVRITNDEEARRLRFLGSPTVQVNGVDIDPSPITGYGMSCRTYNGSGIPSREVIEDAIKAALP